MANKIRPPFAWLGKYTEGITLFLLVATAAFFRLIQIQTLPPGLSYGSAQIGLQAGALIDHGTLPGLNAANGYAPFWVILQALPVKLLGHSVLALNILPALLGILAVFVTWLWVKEWFSLRVAWIASLLMAVNPWAVTLSRTGVESAVIPLLVSLTIYLSIRSSRGRSPWRHLPLVLVLLADLLSGPIGWLTALTVCLLAIIRVTRDKSIIRDNHSIFVPLAAILAGFGALTYGVYAAPGSIGALSKAFNLIPDIKSIGTNIIQTLLMFNVRGDENYRHNLAGEPLLNAFVGLMLVAGILVGISRLHERRYRLLFILLIAMLLPAFIGGSGVPNAAHAIGALPIVMVFAAVGVSYMLELWYMTFPINSAARGTGQAAILVLLALTVFQGYTQYFRAWGGSSEVYNAFNEGAVGIAHAIKAEKFNGQRYVVAPADQLPIVTYLVNRDKAYQELLPQQLAALPIATSSRQFIITAAVRGDAVKIIKLKYPGGTLRPHFSDFNQTEIYYTYELAK